MEHTMIKKIILIFFLLISPAFATVDTFNFTDGSSGNVQQTLGFPTTYTAQTGFANCVIERLLSPTRQKRAMLNFDTSSMADSAEESLVEFKPIDAAGQPATAPDGIQVYIGNFIGGSLDGNVGEYTGGTLMITNITMTSGTWYDLSAGGNDPTGFVDPAGETDIAIRGQYSGGAAQGHNYNTSRDKCQLRVTYTAGRRVIMISIIRRTFDQIKYGGKYTDEQLTFLNVGRMGEKLNEILYN